jgi:hypothetical protein
MRAGAETAGKPGVEMRLSMQFLVGCGCWVILEDWQARAVSRRGLLAGRARS